MVEGDFEHRMQCRAYLTAIGATCKVNLNANVCNARHIRRPAPVGGRRPQPRGEPRRGALCHRARAAARRRGGGRALPGPARGRGAAQRADGPAAGGGGARGVPASVTRRAARRARATVHAACHGDRADGADYADYRGAGAPGDRGRVAGVRGAAALARRGGDRRRADPDLGHAFFARHRGAGRARARERRSGRGDDRRRQHRRRDARHDHRHRARDLERGSAARARPRGRADRDRARAQRGGDAGEGGGAEALRMMLPLTLREVSFLHIIKPLSLEIEAGPSTVILGANGAGKSVLMRLMHGLLAPTSGRIAWNSPGRQAMVFQRPVMLRRSVLANVVYALNVAGQRADGAMEALREVGLAHLAHKPARVLSGGEQQRLALARAWALHPEVLFLDEPTASLDPSATREIETVIRAFDAAGTKIVMATHNLGQARRLGDEVIYLHQGRVVERASADQFFSQPATAEAAAFIRGELPWD